MENFDEILNALKTQCEAELEKMQNSEHGMSSEHIAVSEILSGINLWLETKRLKNEKKAK